MRYDKEELIAKAARLCYFPSSISDLEEEMTKEKCATLIRKLKQLKHGSPFEHVSYTFGIEGISRACLAQITRHRIASFNVQSQRYVKKGNFDFIMPPLIAENTEAANKFLNIMATIQEAYNELISLGIRKEDARFLLPNAVETKIIVTINARSLENFFNIRMKPDAQWEIRELATKMYELVKEVHPNIWSE